MANIKSSKKAIRVIKKRTENNRARKSKVKTFFKKVHDAMAKGVVADARKAFVEFESVLMKAVGKGVFKKNTASRKLSRLAVNIKKMNVAK